MIGENCGIIELREGHPFRPASAIREFPIIIQEPRAHTPSVFGCGKLFEKNVKKVLTKSLLFGIIGV